MQIFDYLSLLIRHENIIILLLNQYESAGKIGLHSWSLSHSLFHKQTIQTDEINVRQHFRKL